MGRALSDSDGLRVQGLGFRLPYMGYIGYVGIMQKKMEATI